MHSVAGYLRAQRSAELLQRWPRFYLEVQKARYRRQRFRRRIVTPRHAIMIEGFPRSGTSFAVQATLQANSELQGRIATHLHAPAHLVRAVQLGVPGMVLVREPAAAVTSLAALGTQQGQLNLIEASGPERFAVVGQMTRRYTRFYRTLRDLADSLMIVRFEDAIADFGAVIDGFNQRFGTAIVRFDHTPDATAEIFARTRNHLSPDPLRNEIKGRLIGCFEAPQNAGDRQAAQAAYLECKAAALVLPGKP